VKNNDLPEDVVRHLLAHSKEYRELIRRRVSEARKAQKKKDASILTYFQSYHRIPYEERPDVDLLGQDIEPCG
jgi:hypothetical protein